MAVYTEVSDDELEAFLAEYDIGEPESFKGIAEGVENSNYLLTTTKGPYFLTLYEKRVDPKDLPFFLGLMDHLAARGINCPRPIHGRDGKALRTLAGRPAAITTFLQGLWPRRMTLEPLRRRSARRWPPCTWPAATSRSSGPMRCRSRAGGRCSTARAITSTRRSRPSWRPRSISSRPTGPTGLPSGVIHADLFHDNVLFLHDRLSGLIDFYFACNDAFAYDVAICLNAWCFEPDKSSTSPRAAPLLQGYESVRPLGADERKVLPLLARGAALRFLLTRLYDWVHTPPDALVKRKDPLEYLAKLRFHRGIASIADYGL